MAICHNGKEGGLVSRRSFLKGGVAVGGALEGCSVAAVPSSLEAMPRL